jgi:hypothetical protein
VLTMATCFAAAVCTPLGSRKRTTRSSSGVMTGALQKPPTLTGFVRNYLSALAAQEIRGSDVSELVFRCSRA